MRRITISLAAFAVMMLGDPSAQASVRSLYEGFMSPPEDCRPGIWLMRFREETPDEVITYDLEHLAAAGLGEFCIYGYGNTSKTKAYGNLVLADRPKIVAKLRKALSEAARLGLKMLICIGPAGCGNERTSPEHATKVLADSRRFVKGGCRVRVSLPRCRMPDTPTEESGLPKYWHDIGVFAVGPKVVEITDCFDAARETVDWEAPAGDWTVVRIGWVPKMFGWVGSYIDPLSREALDEHWRYCVTPLLDAATPEERRAFKGVLCDSWEGGEASWTQSFPEEFQRRRGYPVAEALVAKVGLSVGDTARTAALRRDFDETVGELFADNHYAYQKELAHRDGLVSEAEACGPHQHHGDSRRMQGRCDLCTGEFWMPSPHRPSDPQRFMLRDSATAAHVYGVKEVRAEAFTTMGTHWLESPVMLKPCADRAFCDGLTRIVWHGMLMSDNPNDLPGDTRRAGAYYSPKVTWFPYSKPLNRYFSRCSWMLTQGRFAADCLVYAGDAVGLMAGLKTPSDGLGEGYDYDFCPTELLLRSRVENGELVLPCGMRYRTLFVSDKNPESVYQLPGKPRDTTNLPPVVHHLSHAVREKIGSLRKDGAVIFQTRAEMENWLRQGRLPKDVDIRGARSTSEIDWIHRVIPEGDLYFLANRSEHDRSFEAVFRATADCVTLWDAVTGEVCPASCRVAEGLTTVSLDLVGGESVFVVFSKERPPIGFWTTSDPCRVLEGPWQASFDSKWGGPDRPVDFPKLADWTEHALPGIRHYSGIAIYRKTFDFPDAEGRAAVIDLGVVHEVARVKLNGVDLGIAWTNPFRVHGGALKERDNLLEIEIVNLWPNRLIYDAGLPEAERLTRTSNNPYRSGDSLLPSGLLGPVTVRCGKESPPCD